MKFSINTHQWFLRKMTRTLKLLEMDKTCTINFRRHLNMTESDPVGRFQNGHFRFSFGHGTRGHSAFRICANSNLPGDGRLSFRESSLVNRIPLLLGRS